MVYGKPDQIIRDGGKHEEKEKQAAGFVIKEKTDKEQKGISQSFLLIDQRIYREGHQKESPEIQPRKKQGGILVV